MSRERHPSARAKALSDASAGVAASLASLWIFYPFEVLKTTSQAGKNVKEVKLETLYAGWWTKTLHTTSSSFCYFYLYSWIFSTWNKRGKPLTTATRLLLSAIAAMANTCLTLPLDVISSRQQNNGSANDNQALEVGSSDTEGSQSSHEEDDLEVPIRTKQKNLTAALNHAKELWSGIVPALCLCTNPAINYTVFDMCKSRVLSQKRNRSRLLLSESFLLGLIAKFVATMITYPLIRAKVMLMVTRKRSLLNTLVTEYSRHGVAGLYKGCSLQLLHTLLKSAFLMMARERIHDTAHRIVLGTSQAPQ